MKSFNFSENLRKAMADSNLKQNDLSSRIGITQSAISRWMNGTIPNGEQLHSLSTVLGVSMEWLLTGEGKGVPALEFRQPKRGATRKAIRDARAALDRIEYELGP